MQVDETIKLTLGKAMGRVPSGVFVMSALDEGRPAVAALVSWVQQAAFAPPAVSIALAKDRYIAGVIRRTRRLALSVLGQNDAPLMKRFARPSSPEEDAFAGIDVRRTPGGLPVLAGALAYLDCRLMTICDLGADHDLYVAEVTAGEQLRDGTAFMHQRGNGFHY